MSGAARAMTPETKPAARVGADAIWLLVRRSLRQHALSSSVTACATALACGLVMSVFALQDHSQRAFMAGAHGFDAVVGARGSPLQLVLNAIYHLETSPGNVPYSLYAELRADSRVALAIPFAVGDSFRGFRVVGTIDEFFTSPTLQNERPLRLASDGRWFDSGRMEAVFGSAVARRTGLGVGGVFQPAHGVIDHGDHAHEEEYVVVGVLEPTNTPIDRVVWIPLEGMYRMSGHALRGGGQEYHAHPGEEIPDEHKEVSAILLRLRSAQGGLALVESINRKGSTATLAWPIGAVVADLFSKMGWATRVLEFVAYLVVLVSSGAILAGLYNTIRERRREFAILRALGARRSAVLAVVTAESLTISATGALLGFAVYAGIVGGASWLVYDRTGIQLDVLAPHAALLWTPAAIVLLGVAVGLIPAIKAYSTDVAANLVPHS